MIAISTPRVITSKKHQSTSKDRSSKAKMLKKIKYLLLKIVQAKKFHPKMGKNKMPEAEDSIFV